ncbi:MAG: multicopper oxidase domain-containing protein [Bacteroidota bacterium]|nr:multicopper oxidase domain-containing protein [Bacteroidota bacterium]
MRKAAILFLLFICCSQFAQAQQRRDVLLIMRNTGSVDLWDGETITVWGFAQKLSAQLTLPSPTIYCNEGDTVVIRVRNISQGDPHTIHLHGLDVDQANDGVPHLSFEIKHMEDSVYYFVASHAGTYFYHCHVISVVHVQMGMYGFVVVRPKGGTQNAWTGGPAYDSERLWMTSEIDKAWHDSVPGGNDHDSTLHVNVVIPKYAPDYFLIQGRSYHELKDASVAVYGQMQERIYIRLGNMGFLMNDIHFPAELNVEIIDSDGRPLPNSIFTDSLRICPGERYGILLSPKSEFLDSIRIDFVNMNSRHVLNSQFIPVEIKGHIGISETPFYTPLIYPNPADETVFIEFNADPGADISLRDASGRIIYSTSILSRRHSIPANSISSGLYFLTITQNGHPVVSKVIIQH